MNAPSVRVRVIKLGGSLLDWPELAERFEAWLSRQPSWSNVVVVGGGGLVDAIRAVDRAQRLDQMAVHWLSIWAMSITAQLAAQVLRGARLVHWPLDADVLSGDEGRIAVLDVAKFIEQDQERSDDPLPGGWQVTSDSIAARVAAVLGADELVLLKSTLPEGATLNELAASSYVDGFFQRAAITRPLRLVNLRDGGFAQRVLE
jgi:aspartokinase-like uncharacterized kinase